MAGYRKLGRTSSQRKALLRNQVTNLLYNGKIVTTEAKAKEVQRIAERLITMAVKEKDNYETVKVTAKVPRKDKDGKRIKQIIDKDTKKVLSETHRVHIWHTLSGMFRDNLQLLSVFCHDLPLNF